MCAEAMTHLNMMSWCMVRNHSHCRTSACIDLHSMPSQQLPDTSPSPRTHLLVGLSNRHICSTSGTPCGVLARQDNHQSASASYMRVCWMQRTPVFVRQMRLSWQQPHLLSISCPVSAVAKASGWACQGGVRSKRVYASGRSHPGLSPCAALQCPGQNRLPCSLNCSVSKKSSGFLRGRLSASMSITCMQHVHFTQPRVLLKCAAAIIRTL